MQERCTVRHALDPVTKLLGTGTEAFLYNRGGVGRCAVAAIP